MAARGRVILDIKESQRRLILADFRMIKWIIRLENPMFINQEAVHGRVNPVLFRLCKRRTKDRSHSPTSKSQNEIKKGISCLTLKDE
ncbi:hypothetical protein L1987_73880 [Smallanthus sonchifolius]|uniref:Uncharacterized protein n=1 Tax=Smallanthus sonchifolius TaxID=185202 RepID=A0ACB9A127_9ASTR|nr:hypothetical protein L1987_73880 [Smallanthus sonchifolius]